MPKISVLMGVYNCADTIQASIESIQAQTFTDWEMIICDDGSSDNTMEIVRACQKNDNRIILIRNDRNRGLSYTLNHCLEEAKGEYCARMDGDDLCDPARFQKELDFLEAHPEYGFVSTTMKRFDEDGYYDEPTIGKGYSPTNDSFVKGSPFCHAPAMLRKSTYDAVGGYRVMDNTLGVEDYDMWFRIYAKGIKGFVLEEPLYSMFDGRGAASRRTFKRRINEAWVRKEGYKALNIPVFKRVFVLKPIAVGFIPQWLYVLLRR